MRKHILVCASSMIALSSVSAMAQSQDAATANSAPADASDIIVTGSRTITNGNNAPTPVTVLTTDKLAATTPTNVPDALNKLPLFSNSSSQQSPGNGGANSQGNVLNLRGFGAIRTLILMDGHRVPSTSADGTVDVNTLPQTLMKRVDVVTGGTSAVYGSDAITGVVNFILDHKFNGLTLHGQNGISSRGDDFTWKAGITGGTDIMGGRGHIEGSYEHFDSAGLPNKSDRPVGAGNYSDTGTVFSANTHTSIASFGGLVFDANTFSPFMDFTQNGVLSPFVHGTPTGSFLIESGGNGADFSASSLLASLKTDQAFGRFDYDLADNIHFYAQGAWTRSVNQRTFAPSLFLFQTMSSSNAFLTPAAQSTISGAFGPTFTFNRFFNNAPGVQNRFTVATWSGTAGFEGKLGAFDWDAGFTHSDSQTLGVTLNNLSNGRLAAALDAVSSGGQIVCNVTVTNPGLYPGCIPLNPFGPTAYDPAALDYVRGSTQYLLTNKLDDFHASIHGPIFELPAGPAVLALSGEYRKMTMTNVSSAQPTSTISCTGLRFNCVPGGTPEWFLNVTADMAARENVKEGAIELNVPLLKDSVIARELSINGAVRFSDYSVSGHATTWKIGLDWHLTDDLRLRATRSRDFRAPTLFDLFAPVSASVTGFTDVHTNLSRNVIIQTQGNTSLKPEVSNTTTIGGVYRPSWLPRFSIAVDYYKITMNNAIANVSALDGATQAICEASNGTSPLCSLAVRPLPFSDRTAANFPTLLLAQPVNISRTSTYGFDIEANYGFNLGNGAVDLRLLASNQPSFKTQLLPVTPVVDVAGAAESGTGVPKWKMNFQAQYANGPLTLSLAERWRSSLRPSNNPDITYANPKISAVAYTDLTAKVMIPTGGRKLETFLSVQNLFDKKPPIYAPTGASSVPGLFVPAVLGDDVVGTFMTVGVKLDL